MIMIFADDFIFFSFVVVSILQLLLLLKIGVYFLEI